MPYWLVILIGLLGGVAVGFQTPISGAIGGRIGAASSSFIIHLGGLIATTILLVARGGEKIRDWTTIPWYMLGAGVFGLVLFLTTTVTLPRVGGAMMVVLIVIGQLSVGLLIDHFGLLGVIPRPVDWPRLAGAAVLVLGAYLVSR